MPVIGCCKLNVEGQPLRLPGVSVSIKRATALAGEEQSPGPGAGSFPVYLPDFLGALRALGG
jgi:hypothetical protein